MATGSALDSQLGTVTETAVGTKKTVTHFFPFNSAGLTFTPSYIENSGIQAGRTIRGISQTGLARKAASGRVEMPIMQKESGWWFKHLIGSTADPVLDGTTLPYKQIHIPGGLKGLSFTAQVGKPQPSDGVVKPATYNGCKITDWEITFADNEFTMLSATIDAWDEDGSTALATASYQTGNLGWNFADVTSFTTGGTVGYSTDEMTYTGGTSLDSVITRFSISGRNALATERYGLGNAGIKKEQLQNDFTELTGTFEGEYDATWDTPFRAGTTTTFQITCEGADIESGAPYLFDVIIPAAKITAAPAEISGPGIISVRGEFKIYDPEVTDESAIQFKIRSTDDDSAFTDA